MGLNEGNKIQLPIFGSAVECRPQLVGSNCLVPTVPTREIHNDEVPSIVPCYNGRTLKIQEELVWNGLSAISIKHHKGNCKDDRRSSDGSTSKTQSKCEDVKDNKENGGNSKKVGEYPYKNFSKGTSEVPECLKDKMKRRNSFWNIHRPELSKLTWPENFVSSAVLQDFFHNHLRIHGTFCEPLHEFGNRLSLLNEEFLDYSKLREIVPPRILPPDEKVVNIKEKSRSVELNDEDLDPKTMVHKSRAEFCVTIGEYIRRPPLRRTTSQQLPKCIIQQANRFESLPLQHEELLSKETMNSEERVSAVIGCTDLNLNKKGWRNQSSGAVSGHCVRRTSSPSSHRLGTSPSLNDLQHSSQTTVDGRDPARLRTILSPREEGAEDSGSRYRYGALE